MSTFQEKLKKASLWMKDRITQGIEHGKRTLLGKYKKHVIISSITAGVLFSGSAIGYTYYQAHIQPIYHVYFQNQQIGTVDSPDVVNDWIENRINEETTKYEHVTFQVNDKVIFEEEELYKPTYDNQGTLKELEELFDLKATAVRLEIDGQFIGYISDESTIYTLLDEMKSEYVSEDFLVNMNSEGAKQEKNSGLAVASLLSADPDGQVDPEAAFSDQVVQGQAIDMQALEFDKLHMTMARIQQEVSIHETVVHPSQVMDEDKLNEILHGTKIEEQVYHVQPGDVLGSIAQAHDLTTSELLELNPDLSADQLLQIDQEIVVMGSKSFISVETIEQVKKVEGIPFNTEHKQTDELYQGERRTEKQGSNGKKAVVYEVLKVDGKEVTRKPIDEEVIEEPVDEVILIGTKVKPSRGSGKFAWPTVGGKVTSGFGMRWGRQHAGIDIAGVKDKTIKASDNGKVVTAGYHKGYGNHVVVDHGNGYKTLYGHLSSIDVSVNDVVEKGDKLGVMGSTGNSTGVHLHFEVIKNGRSVNPAKYVSR